DLTQTMVVTAEGCLLPDHLCDLFKSETLNDQTRNRFVVGMAVLTHAMVHLADRKDCVQGRKGIIDSVSFVWGNTGFALASTSNSESAPCFVQRLKV
ncbi:MAG: hypothetical protein AAFU63_14770, partial [Pseudomonadota bacterium]